MVEIKPRTMRDKLRHRIPKVLQWRKQESWRLRDQPGDVTPVPGSWDKFSPAAHLSITVALRHGLVMSEPQAALW